MASDTEIATAGPDDGTAANSASAALLAAGIGCLAMGIVTTLSEAIKPVADALNLYKPTGPLSGKSTVTILAWLITWAAFSRFARNRKINSGRWITVTMVCVVIGFVMTFPPFFDLFGDK